MLLYSRNNIKWVIESLLGFLIVEPLALMQNMSPRFNRV